MKLIKLLIIAILSFAIAIPAMAQNNEQNTQEQKSTPSILQSLLSIFKSPENRLTTRGEKVCLISPGKLGENTVHSDRPLLIWSLLQPDVPESNLNFYSDTANFNYEQDSQLVWNQTIPANTPKILYAGEILQPGIYKWELVFPDKTYSSEFTLMGEAEREAITTELSSLRQQLTASNKNESEKAIAIADFFAQKGLLSDSIQQLYSIEQPSTELLTKRQEMENYFCSSSEDNG